MNRREFLHPRRLINIAGPVLAIVDELDGEEPSSAEPLLLHFARRAMATTFEVILPFGTPAPNEIAQAVLDEIDRLEAQLTVFRESSDVSRLNAKAAHHPVRVDQILFDLLALAERLHRETEGAFDISVGALIKTWGFFRRAGRVPTPQERADVRERIGMQHVRLDPERRSVFYQRKGLEINLGSIGKGYALDRALALVRAHTLASPPGEQGRVWGTNNILIHGGHSSVFALGSETPGSSGWTIGLVDPVLPHRRRGLLHLRNRAMATSAATYQHFEFEGRKLGHLLDPRSGWPAEGMLSATATAPTAAEADALATAFFILGVEKTRAWCEQHPDFGAVLIAADAAERLVVCGRAVDEVEATS
jgi:thiamine biosynthesis lipoprotein